MVRILFGYKKDLDTLIQRPHSDTGAFPVLAGVAIATAASAVVGVLLLKARPIKETDAGVDTVIESNIPTV